MKWTNLELGEVWHRDDDEDIYKLVLEISNDWKVASEKLWQLSYYDHKDLYKNYSFLINNTIHDGNRANGVVDYYEKVYEEAGNYKSNSPWTSLRGLLHYIRLAEILIELIEEKIK